MVNRPLKLLDTVNMRHLGITTSADGGNDALEVTIGGVVDDPAALSVLVDLLDPRLELGALIQPVRLPDMPHLAEDLLPVGVSAIPANRRVKSEHG